MGAWLAVGRVSVDSTTLARCDSLLHLCQVPTFVLLLVGEMIMVVGGSGAGFQVVYFEVGPLALAGIPVVLT